MKEVSIEDIIRNFDFQKVQDTMLALNWTWRDNNRVPTKFEMKRAVRKLYKEYVRNKIKYGAEGIISRGFYISQYGEDGISLQFVVEEMNNDFVDGQ